MAILKIINETDIYCFLVAIRDVPWVYEGVIIKDERCIPQIPSTPAFKGKSSETRTNRLSIDSIRKDSGGISISGMIKNG